MHDNKAKIKPNSLINESSPYLLQHAYNPVQWYAWNEKSLNKARSEDKPIFLSVGYSPCHWCHVMAHESFENEDIAKLMNEYFVNIKVDREERPDIDDIYQKACQLTTGTGGWPLSVFLTPDQKPFYTGTYFPHKGRNGIVGFDTLLIKLAQVYKEKKEQVIGTSTEFMTALNEYSNDLARQDDVKIEKSLLEEAAVRLLYMGDNLEGGFGQAPKFPNASNLLFLLRMYELTGISRYKDFVSFTAKKMASGGIYDHIGGGFSRYSTDRKWLVPHFEKMIYDNALLSTLYSELYSISDDQSYISTIDSILKFVLREMTSPEGGFYSSQDADSEGEEGKFYIWGFDELKEYLDEDISSAFLEHFGASQVGNFEGMNILHISSSLESLSRKYSQTERWLSRRFDEMKNKLYEIRNYRVKPETDRKILTSWNGLMISGFISGYKATGNISYLDAARKAINFIETLSRNGTQLRRIFMDGTAKINGYLDDYVFFISSLLDTFGVDSNPRYLDSAIKYTDYLMEHFWDPKIGDFFFSSDDNEKLILRTKNHYDLAIPSGNSVAVNNLFRLYIYTNNEIYQSTAKSIAKISAKSASENPFGFGNLLSSIYNLVKPPIEISVVRKENESPMFSWLRSQYIPNAITSNTQIDNLDQLQRYPYFAGKNILTKKVEYAFVCKNFVCSLPIMSLSDFQKEIKVRN
jgi:uncharacterized protein YyaL (SSP411 family)